MYHFLCKMYHVKCTCFIIMIISHTLYSGTEQTLWRAPSNTTRTYPNTCSCTGKPTRCATNRKLWRNCPLCTRVLLISTDVYIPASQYIPTKQQVSCYPGIHKTFSSIQLMYLSAYIWYILRFCLHKTGRDLKQGWVWTDFFQSRIQRNVFLRFILKGHGSKNLKLNERPFLRILPVNESLKNNNKVISHPALTC